MTETSIGGFNVKKEILNLATTDLDKFYKFFLTLILYRNAAENDPAYANTSDGMTADEKFAKSMPDLVTVSHLSRNLFESLTVNSDSPRTRSIIAAITELLLTGKQTISIIDTDNDTDSITKAESAPKTLPDDFPFTMQQLFSGYQELIKTDIIQNYYTLVVLIVNQFPTYVDELLLLVNCALRSSNKSYVPEINNELVKAWNTIVADINNNAQKTPPKEHLTLELC